MISSQMSVTTRLYSPPTPQIAHACLLDVASTYGHWVNSSRAIVIWRLVSESVVCYTLAVEHVHVVAEAGFDLPDPHYVVTHHHRRACPKETT
jgi:hypothetical protein